MESIVPIPLRLRRNFLDAHVHLAHAAHQPHDARIGNRLPGRILDAHVKVVRADERRCNAQSYTQIIHPVRIDP